MRGNRNNRLEKKSVSLTKLIKILGVIISTIAALQLVVSSIILFYINKHSVDAVKETAEFYVNDMNVSMERITNLISNLIFEDNNVNILRYSDNPLQEIQAKKEVLKKMDLYQELYGTDFNYFMYVEKDKSMISPTDGKSSLLEAVKMNSRLYDIICAKYVENGYRISSKWGIISINGKWMIYSFQMYDNVWICGYAFVDQLSQSKTSFPLPGREDSYLLFCSKEAEVYNTTLPIDNESLKNHKKKLIEDGYYTSFTSIATLKEVPSADFGILIFDENNEDLNAALLVQIFLLTGLVLLLIIVVIAVTTMWNRVISPVRYFSNNLAAIQQNKEAAFSENNSIVELEEANQLFAAILKQIKQLRIEIYEKTLSEQKMQLEYLQLQIRPHFYINCMSIISSMACMGEFEAIQKLASHISDYFRYVFKTNSNEAYLKEELQHVSNYLEICKIRHHREIDFTLVCEKDMEYVKVPILLLHTFVENSVKYGADRSGNVHISIKVTHITMEEMDLVRIEIEDGGKGFPEAVLESLQKKEIVMKKEGERIGIHNCISRLKLLYHDNIRWAVYNKESGGALVTLCIPYSRGVR